MVTCVTRTTADRLNIRLFSLSFPSSFLSSRQLHAVSHGQLSFHVCDDFKFTADFMRNAESGTLDPLP